MSKKQKVDTTTGELITDYYPWRTQFNRVGQQKQEADPVGKTVPGQSLTMSEIITRYQQGRPLVAGQSQFGGYDLEEPLPDLRKMDISEVYDLKRENDQKLDAIRSELVTKEKQQKDLAEKQAREKYIEQELDRREKQKSRKDTSEDKIA